MVDWILSLTGVTVREGIQLPGKWESLGKLEPLSLAADAGWLSVAWRVPVTEKVARKQ